MMARRRFSQKRVKREHMGGKALINNITGYYFILETYLALVEALNYLYYRGKYIKCE